MFRRFLKLAQTLTILFIVVIFMTCIIAGEEDEFTFGHFLATALSSIPLIFILMVRYVVYGFKKT